MTHRTPEQTAVEVGKVFTPAVPVNDRDLFTGRIHEIRRLVDAINQRGQHAAIFGSRGVGKTSLANIIGSKLQSSAPILAPHVTCNSTDDFASIWRNVLSHIALVESRRAPGFQTSAEGTRTAADAVGDRITPEELRRLFSAIGGSRILLVILDEFDRLNASARRTVADTIKTFADHSVPATIIVVGVAETVAELIAEHQSIERVLVQVEMPRMTPDDLTAILSNGTARLDMTIAADAAHLVALLSQGMPYYTQLLGLHATRRAIDDNAREVSMTHVMDAIGYAVSDSQASLRTAFHKAIDSARQRSRFGEVLLACALARTDDFGWFRPADVRDPLSRIRGEDRDTTTFVRHLKRFCEAERGAVLEQSGTRQPVKYRFTNALMPPLILMQGVVEERITATEVEKLTGLRH